MASRQGRRNLRGKRRRWQRLQNLHPVGPERIGRFGVYARGDLRWEVVEAGTERPSAGDGSGSGLGCHGEEGYTWWERTGVGSTNRDKTLPCFGCEGGEPEPGCSRCRGSGTVVPPRGTYAYYRTEWIPAEIAAQLALDFDTLEGLAHGIAWALRVLRRTAPLLASRMKEVPWMRQVSDPLQEAIGQLVDPDLEGMFEEFREMVRCGRGVFTDVAQKASGRL